MSATGLRAMLRVQWRTHRRGTLIWMLALIAMMVGTAGSIAGLYPTPEKIHSYAQAATAGDALVAINGKVEGIDSLGGIIQDEFGFFAAFLLPLLGISLVAQATRREEESGRLETVLGGRVARHVPVLAGLTVASAAIVATSIAFALGLIAFGVPATRSVLYAASLGTLAFVFAGLAALLAQVTLHARGVYTWGLLVLGVAYVLRGVGDVTKTWVTWLSPLGWAEKAAPFGDMRWWTLLIPLAVGGLLAALAVLVAGRRDLGSALLRGGAGSARATSWLRSPLGLATAIHRPAIARLARRCRDPRGHDGRARPAVHRRRARQPGHGRGHRAVGCATRGRVRRRHPALPRHHRRGLCRPGRRQPARRGDRGTSRDPAVRHPLPPALARRPRARHRHRPRAHRRRLHRSCSPRGWPGRSARRRASARCSERARPTCPRSSSSPGWRWRSSACGPRASRLAWAGLAGVTFIAFLGPGLKLPAWVLDLAPTTHVGNPPLATVEAPSLVALGAIAAALWVAAAVGFRRRGVPQT